MAAKLIYVRFDYNVSSAPEESVCFIARRRVKENDGVVYCGHGRRKKAIRARW